MCIVFFFKCHLMAHEGYMTQTAYAIGTESSDSRAVC